MSVLEIVQSLPGVDELRRRSQALAMCEAIISPDWESRYYSYDSRWSVERGEHLASMRNGSGDEYSIVFSPAGVWIRGLDHEAKPAAGLFDDVPAVFAGQVGEPAFGSGANICLWRETGDEQWHGRGLDDVSWLFEMLVDGSPEAYQEFAEDYYEEDVDLAAVTEVFGLRPLTDKLVRRLNPAVTVKYLDDDITEIDYPR